MARRCITPLGDNGAHRAAGWCAGGPIIGEKSVRGTFRGEGTGLGRSGVPDASGWPRSWGARPFARATVGVVDDPYDLTESAWRRRFSRRLAEARSLERARTRAAALAVTELTVPRIPRATGAPSPALLAHLARVRPRGHRARWQGVDAATRSAFMAWVVRHRWARTSPELRRAVGVALARAHWKHPDPSKIVPRGGVNR